MKGINHTIKKSVMKTFANYSDLIKKNVGKDIYIELSNGYYVKIDKCQLKRTADSMSKADDKFCGEILEHSKSCVKISLTN